MNSISVAGRLGKDSELRVVGENSVLNFNVGSDVGFGDKKKTLWFSCAVWGKRATSLEQYLKKGQAVTVFGQLSTREYTNKEGANVTSLEVNVNDVVLQGGKKEDPSEEGPF